ncbi:hypothetical protein ElyMa_002316100 [Elysia marginata]|uniref:Uncharacterized protein n=1 Tax=Elysia marginata TaxID=1093978 RepID=A0AAV4G4A4_9GAST|nr:hypothetical protein ElyMa_002316100 [Elysia marginata]
MVWNQSIFPADIVCSEMGCVYLAEKKGVQRPVSETSSVLDLVHPPLAPRHAERQTGHLPAGGTTRCTELVKTWRPTTGDGSALSVNPHQNTGSRSTCNTIHRVISGQRAETVRRDKSGLASAEYHQVILTRTLALTQHKADTTHHWTQLSQAFSCQRQTQLTNGSHQLHQGHRDKDS